MNTGIGQTKAESIANGPLLEGNPEMFYNHVIYFFFFLDCDCPCTVDIKSIAERHMEEKEKNKNGVKRERKGDDFPYQRQRR